MSNVRRWAATASVTAILLAGASPARAADEGSLTWTMAPCVTVEAMRPGFQLNRLWNTLEGSVAQCDPVVEGGGFRIATYSPEEATGTAPGYNVRLFTSTTPGEVVEFGAPALPGGEGVSGVCVLAGENERFGCFRVEVSYGEIGYIDLVYPLATDDPLVDKEVVMSPYTGTIFPRRGSSEAGPWPACGTCF